MDDQSFDHLLPVYTGKSVKDIFILLKTTIQCITSTLHNLKLRWVLLFLNEIEMVNLIHQSVGQWMIINQLK